MKYIIITLIIFLQACKPYKINSSRAHLFDSKPCNKLEEDECLNQISAKTPHNYPYYGGNPTFVATDAKFSIVLDQIKAPPLIYQNKFNKETKYLFKKTTDSVLRQKYGPLSDNRIERNINSKQLWLLSTIKSQNVDDPLEANSKTYTKSTQVKWDSGSNLLVPLDKEERIIFTHDADASYKVSFQLMEVDSLELKKQIAILRNQTGILNAVEIGINTFLELFNTVVGKELVLDKVNAVLKNDTAFQRFLLSIGASVEFYGEFLILRKESTFNVEYPDQLHKEQKFYLIDGFRKSINQSTRKKYKQRDKFQWNLGEGKTISVSENNGIIKGQLTDDGSEEIILENLIKHDLDNDFDDPGYISFKVLQIPNKQTIDGSLVGDGVNNYYDYKKLQHYLDKTNSNIFDEILNCYGNDNDNDKKNEDGKTYKCKKLKYIFGMSNNYNKIRYFTDINHLKSDDLTNNSNTLQSKLFNFDFELYSEYSTQYKNIGKRLRCFDDELEKNYKKLKNIYCSGNEYNRTNAIIEKDRLRDEKNYSFEELKNLKRNIINGMYHNIANKCEYVETTKKDKIFKIADKDYSCEVFSSINNKIIEFENFKILYHRVND